MEKIDVILKTEAKRRSNIQPESLRWNAVKHVFEFWDGSVWQVAYEDIIAGGTSLELEEHKRDPSGHPLATATNPGFMSEAYAAKLDSITGIDSLGPFDPDPTEIFNLVLKG